MPPPVIIHGRYELGGKPAGQGRMGVVYKAFDVVVKRYVALKGMLPLAAPGHRPAKSLQGLVLDNRRREILNECVSQARERQASGDLSGALAGALARVEEVLASYPVKAQPASLPKEAHEQKLGIGNPRPAASGDVFPIERGIAGAPSEPQRAPSPPMLRQALGGLRVRCQTLLRQAGRQLDRFWIILQDFAGPQGSGSRLQWALMIVASAILVLALGVTYIPKARQAGPPPPPPEYLVDVQSNVVTAKYTVDGNPPSSLPLRLPPGAHRVEAAAPGYRPDTQSFTLSPDAPKPFVVAFRLEPELVRLRLSSDLKSGKVSLDGQPVDLQNGRFANDAISLSTEHTLSLLQSGKESLVFSFGADAGGMVALSTPVKANDIAAVLISSLGSRARVYTSTGSLKGGLKGQTPRPIPPEGLEFHELTGSSDLTVDDGKFPRTVPIEMGNAPTLTIWMASDPNRGTLEVEVRVLDAAVSIDGRKPQPLRPGPNPLSLEPGMHTLRFTKDGYEALEQKVELKTGEVRRLAAFDPKPAIRTASLAIESATPGAEVLVDGNPHGTIGSDGSFKLDDLPPEAHTITLRKADFEEKQLSRTFTVGQTVRISGSEGQLTPFGTLEFRVSPQSANITYKRAEEAQAHAAENGRPARVRAGRYVITASGSGARPRMDTVTVEPGKSLPIEWLLTPAPEEPKKGPGPVAPPPPKQPTLTRDYFQDPAAWAQDGAWSIHKGDTVGWLRANQGTFVIEFLRQRQNLGIVKRTKHVEWLADQRALTNQIDYSFDFGSLERRATVDGKTESKKVKLPPAAASSDSYTLQIEIGPDQIVIRDAQGKELDRYQRPNRVEPLGTFGFKGDVALAVKRAE